MFSRFWTNSPNTSASSAPESHSLTAAIMSSTGIFSMDASIDTLSDWMLIAARDGALAIYHFGKTLEAIKKSLPGFPTLNSEVDHNLIRKANADYRKRFPRYEAIRHVVAHSAEFSATQAKRELHANKGPLVARAVGATKGIRFSDSLIQRTYIVNFEGDAHSYEITHASADCLFLSKLMVYSTLGIVTTLNPHP